MLYLKSFKSSSFVGNLVLSFLLFRKSKYNSLLTLNLKGVFAKNERGYRLTAKKALLITTNLTSICCVYKEIIVKNDSC